jgi:hypothetical protein
MIAHNYVKAINFWLRKMLMRWEATAERAKVQTFRYHFPRWRWAEGMRTKKENKESFSHGRGASEMSNLKSKKAENITAKFCRVFRVEKFGGEKAWESIENEII